MRDNGAQRLTSTAKIYITVLDENDNPPVFKKQSYTFSAKESINTDWTFGLVSATDKDQGSNGVIEYSIVDGNQQGTTDVHIFTVCTGFYLCVWLSGRFEIVADSGNVVLVASLDYETVRSYTLTVRASNAMSGVPRITHPVPVLQVDQSEVPVWNRSQSLCL